MLHVYTDDEEFVIAESPEDADAVVRDLKYSRSANCRRSTLAAERAIVARRSSPASAATATRRSQASTAARSAASTSAGGACQSSGAAWHSQEHSTPLGSAESLGQCGWQP